MQIGKTRLALLYCRMIRIRDGLMFKDLWKHLIQDLILWTNYQTQYQFFILPSKSKNYVLIYLSKFEY